MSAAILAQKNISAFQLYILALNGELDDRNII